MNGTTLLHTKAQLSAPTPCDTCRNGCDCDGTDPTSGCGHYGCWGKNPTRSCPGIAYEEARTAAIMGGGERQREMLRAARRRGPEVHARVVASILTAAGLPVTTPELAA